MYKHAWVNTRTSPEWELYLIRREYLRTFVDISCRLQSHMRAFHSRLTFRSVCFENRQQNPNLHQPLKETFARYSAQSSPLCHAHMISEIACFWRARVVGLRLQETSTQVCPGSLQSRTSRAFLGLLSQLQYSRLFPETK